MIFNILFSDIPIIFYIILNAGIKNRSQGGSMFAEKWYCGAFRNFCDEWTCA